MKKVLSVLLAVLLVVAVLPMGASAAGDFVIENGVLVNYDGPGGDVVIPEGVTEIGEGAFSFTTLKSVVIPEGVTEIGSYAFFYCSNLTTVTLPQTLTVIGDSAFYECSSLKTITIPDNVTDIRDDTFSACRNLTSLHLPNNLDYIGSFAFFDCSGLTTVVIPSGTTTIDHGAFAGCYNLEGVIIPLSVKYIGSYGLTNEYNSHKSTAFARCSELKDVHYEGNESQWDAIGDVDLSHYDEFHEMFVYYQTTILATEELKQNCTMHYNSKGPGSGTTPTPSPKPTPTPVPTVGGFKDVKKSDYFASHVVWAVEKGITGGTSKTTFSPNADCNREQIMTFLWAAKGRPAATKTAAFTDMPTNKTYQKAINWAVENGITGGVSKTKFGPKNSCTRAQAMVFLWAAAGRPEPKSTATFKDMPSNKTYRKAISWGVENRITGGTSKTTFSPDKPCTRAQIVTFLHNAEGK